MISVLLVFLAMFLILINKILYIIHHVHQLPKLSCMIFVTHVVESHNNPCCR
jgi:hypothetical protein